MGKGVQIISLILMLLLCPCVLFAQGNNMRIKPVPPPKTGATDNAPLNPRMFIMLILRYKMQPIKLIPEYVAKEYNGKVPVYSLEKMDPELFKVYKSPNLSPLPAQWYVLTVSREMDELKTVNVIIPAIKFPPPEVDPVNTLAMRSNKTPGGDGAGNIGGPNATKVAVPKTAVPIPDADPVAVGNGSLAERTPMPTKHKSSKKGYKNIVFEKKAVREVAVNTPPPVTAKSTVPAATATTTAPPAFRSDIPIIYDTIRSSSWRRRSLEEEMVVTSHHDTIYIVPGDYEDTYVETSVKPEVRPSISQVGTCKCMEMVMTAQDTINFEDYVNYGFSFKNNCKEYVYVHSFSFRFSVSEMTGYPAKRIRRIDFVKRFDYPEYVKIKPGQSFDYHFADDPFFEYELVRGKQYKFTFMYNNFTNKSPSAPQQTHLCNDPRDKVIYVQ